MDVLGDHSAIDVRLSRTLSVVLCRPLEVAHELIDHLVVTWSHHEMEPALLPVEIPTSGIHLVAHCIDVEHVATELEEAHVGIGCDVKPFDATDSSSETTGSVENSFGEAQIARFTEMGQRSPCTGDRRSRTSSGRCR